MASAVAFGSTLTTTATVNGTAGVSLNVPATAAFTSTLSGDEPGESTGMVVSRTTNALRSINVA